MTASLVNKKLRHYRVVRRVGAGGMGTVYLARTLKERRGLPAGTEVALKVLHPHLAESRDLLRRFQREAGLGLTIRHPRVVATYDVGSERVGAQTIHYLVMELLTCRTLRQAIDEDGPFSDERVVSVGRQLAEALAEVHAHGVIHRDIKPTNVFLDGDRVKLADLGLSRLLEPTTEISIPGTILGSAGYAAPEQMDGDGGSKASDLYSVGVLMYELASGRNPFVRDDFQATVRAHATATPPPLGRVVRVSYFTECVVAALLSKEPSERLGPASRLQWILEERERSDFWRAYVAGDEPAARLSNARRRLRVRRATRVYGRDDEVETLVDVVRTAAVGRTGAMALVTGESGVGRTRVIDASIELAEREGIPIRFLVARFLDQATPVPYFALNALLLSAFELDKAPREERLVALPGVLRAHLPERAVFADAFADLIVGRESEALSRLPPNAIPALYAEVLRALAAKSALCLVLEELQWADKGSVRVLTSLFPTLSIYPLAIVSTACDVVLSTESTAFEPRSADEELAAMSARDEVVTVDLARLEWESVRDVVFDLAVPSAVSEPLVDRLLAQSEGNPKFLFALVDELDRRDRLRELTAEEVAKIRLPASIRELIERRLDELDKQARRFVEFAAVFGTRFKLEDIVAGLGLDWMTASEVVARLRRHRVLKVAEQAYQFDHHLMKEVLYRGIPEGQRREDNRAVARVLAGHVSDPHAPTQQAYEAAIHFSLAGEHDEAARHLVGAVHYLTGRSLHERAARFARQARTHVESSTSLAPDDRFAVYESLAGVTGHLGLRREQGSALRAASRVAHDAGDDRRAVHAEILLARHAGSTGMVFTALDHAERAKADAARHGFKDLHAAAIRVESTVLWLLGQVDHEQALLDAGRLADEAGDHLGVAFGQMQLGRLYLATDRPSRALETLKSALAAFEELRDERGRGRALFQIARVYREFADLTRADQALRFAERIADGNQDRGLAARCLYLRGDVAMRSRDHARAERLLHAALKGLVDAADPTFQVYALAALSLLYTSTRFEGRDPRRAIEFAQRSARVARELGVPRLAAYTYAVLAVAYLARGKTRFALAVSQKGMRYLEREEPGRKRKSELLFIHYRCLKAVGRLEEARSFLRDSAVLIRERATEIERDDMRRSFLENDLFNRTVLAEAARVLGATPA